MEIESSSAAITSKKLWKKVKVVVAKTKLLVHLHIKLKNGKLARKALTNLLLHHHHHHHYAAFTCRCSSSNIDTLFISPQKPISSSGSEFKHLNEKNKVVFEGLSNGKEPPTPIMAMSHELRVVVDSPLQAERECQVDKEAEAFIEKFYKQLKQQHIESPSPNHSWTL